VPWRDVRRSPIIVLQRGKLRAVVGGSGGPLIVSAVLQTLVRCVQFVLGLYCITSSNALRPVHRDGGAADARLVRAMVSLIHILSSHHPCGAP